MAQSSLGQDGPKPITEKDVGSNSIQRAVLVERPNSTDFAVFLKLYGEPGWRYLSLRRPKSSVKSFSDYWALRNRMTKWGYAGSICCIRDDDAELRDLGIILP